MRYAIFTFAALNLAWYIAIAIAPPSFRETAGEGWVIFIGMILAAFHLPALLLVFLKKAEWLALLLVLVPLILFLYGAIRAWAT